MAFQLVHTPESFDRFALRDPRLDFLASELCRDPMFSGQGVTAPSGRRACLNLYLYIRPLDLIPPDTGETFRFPEACGNLCYSFLICHENHAVMAGPLQTTGGLRVPGTVVPAIPSAIHPAVNASQLSQEQLLEAVRASLRLWAQNPSRTAWRYDCSSIHFQHWPVLANMGLLDRARCSDSHRLSAAYCPPTLFGREQGIGEHVTPDGYSICCTPALWKRLHRQTEYGPEWQPLSLETRLKRLDAGLACNPGHYLTGLQNLKDMPLPVFLSHAPNSLKGIEDILSPHRASEYTVSQFCQEVDRRMHDPDSSGDAFWLMWMLANPFAVAYKIRAKKDQNQKTNTVVVQAGGTQKKSPKQAAPVRKHAPAQVPLETRLRQAGFSRKQTWMKPLTGDLAPEVLKAVGRAIGSDYPAWLAEQLVKNNFSGFTPETDGGEQDLTYDAILWKLVKATESPPDLPDDMEGWEEYADWTDPEEWNSAAQLLYLLLIEPFCLLSASPRGPVPWSAEEHNTASEGK